MDSLNQKYLDDGEIFYPNMKVIPAETIYNELLKYGNQSGLKVPLNTSNISTASILGDENYDADGVQYTMSLYFKKQGWQNKDDEFISGMIFSACFMGIGMAVLRNMAKTAAFPKELPYTNDDGTYNPRKAALCLVSEDSVWDIDHDVFKILGLDLKDDKAREIHRHVSLLTDFVYMLGGIRFKKYGIDVSFQQVRQGMIAMLRYGAVLGNICYEQETAAKEKNILSRDVLYKIQNKYTGYCKFEHMGVSPEKETYTAVFSDPVRAETYYKEVEKYGNVGAYMQPVKKMLRMTYVVTVDYYPVV